MSLLRDIQGEAITPQSEIATLLRKCLILAHRLESEEFKRWVTQELNGYTDTTSLPDYRRIRVESYGDFTGPFGSRLKNAPIPLFCLPEEARDRFRHAYLTEPIVSLAMLIEQGKDGRSPQETWPPEVVAFVASDIYSGMNCLAAWKIIPTNALQAIIDTIKTRALNFTLTIEAEAPDAGEALPRTTPLPQERVSQVFHTYIAGDVQNVAAGGPVNQRASITNTPSEQVFRNLLAAVERAPAPADEVEAMTVAIEEMEESCGTAQFGEKYLRFMAVLADHMQVFGPLVGPCLPALTRLAI